VTQQLDRAVADYWRNRPQPSRRRHVLYLRARQRQTTPPEVWLRRAGVAA
jgi:hypothetical protein